MPSGISEMGDGDWAESDMSDISLQLAALKMARQARGPMFPLDVVAGGVCFDRRWPKKHLS